MNIRIQADYAKSQEMLYREVATVSVNRVPIDDWLRLTGVRYYSRMLGLPIWLVD